jgi:hypothetical protein
MAYRQQLKLNLKVGRRIKVIVNGSIIEGEIIQFDGNQALQDTDVVLRQDDGSKVLVPLNINSQYPIIIPPAPEDEIIDKGNVNDDELLDDDELEIKKLPGKDVLPNYAKMESRDLIKAAKKKGIDIKKNNGRNRKKTDIIADLNEYDKKHYGSKKK